MKSFFKKLAFVMALAMVVSLAAPAAQRAAAATEFTYAEQESKEKITALSMEVGDEVDLCFIGVRDYRNYTLKWVSYNEAVATVDKMGVITAVANGVATVELQVGDGTDYVSTPVVVTVGEVASVALGTSKENTFATYTLGLDETVDLNFYGVTDWAASKYTCVWHSSDETVVTVDKMGVVTPVAAGTAEVTIIIVNKTTGFAWNVTPVEFTVAADEETPEPAPEVNFTVNQISTDTVELVFDSEQAVTTENLEFGMVIDGILVSLPIKSVSVKDMVATVVLYSVFEDAVDYAFVYSGKTVPFTASVGEIDRVTLIYWTDKEGDGKAYVSTEEEYTEVHLGYVLYDKNGVDITSKYNDGDFSSVEYELLSTNDAYDLNDDTMTFEAAVAASVKLTIAWINDEGEEVPKVAVGAVIAEKRPALSHTLVAGGFIGFWWGDSRGAWDDFTTNANGYIWKNTTPSTSMVFGDADYVQFAALVKNNRGETIATGAEYDRGQFIYKTSNEKIFDIDELDGTLIPRKDGTASVLVYYVDPENEKEVFVGAVKITIRPARYVATYKITETTKTVASVGLSTGNSFELTAYDQYGDVISLRNDENDITVEVSGSNGNPPSLSVSKHSWNGRYYISFNADQSNLDGKSSYTYKYKVSVDKEENSKLTTGSTTVTVKVQDKSKSDTELVNFIKHETVSIPAKFYYSVSGAGNIDVALNGRMKNFNWIGNNDPKEKTISIKYLDSSNGFAMENVPAEYIIDKKANGVNLTTGDIGKVYFEVSPAKGAYKDQNYTYTVTDGAIKFVFNGVNEDGTINFAPNGAYKVTLYTTTSNEGKLKAFGSYSINVSKSQPEPSFVGYNENSGDTASDNIDNTIKEEQVIELVKKHLVFSCDDAIIDLNAEYTIKGVKFTPLNGKVYVDKITIAGPLCESGKTGTFTDISVGKYIYGTK